MSRAVGIFGIGSADFNQRIMAIRKVIRDQGWEVEEQETGTLAHLTLAVNQEFEGETDRLEEYLKQLTGRLQEFKLPVAAVELRQGNLAAVFDNFFSRRLARMISRDLEEWELKPIDTDYMKLIRSTVKEKYRQEAENLLREAVPEQIGIKKLVIAGGMIREEDIIAGYLLKSGRN